MSEDNLVNKLVWDGKIPVCLNLAREEIAASKSVPSPFYLLAPRISYFPLILDRAISYLLEYTEHASGDKPQRSKPNESKPTEVGVEASEQLDASSKPCTGVSHECPPEHTVWLEYATQPLKWHYPIGLLFDLYASKSDLPWQITLHFQNYPLDILLNPPVNRKAVEVHFMNALKEADALKHRSQVMNQMQAHDHRQLWSGLFNLQFEQFWGVNRRLMEPINETHSTHRSDAEAKENNNQSDSSPSTTRASRGFRAIPCRLYGVRTSSGNALYVQKRLPPCTNQGEPLSLIEAVKHMLASESEGAASNVAPKDYNFVLHGIRLPEETPIQWISEHLAYADNFIHLVALPKETQSANQLCA